MADSFVPQCSEDGWYEKEQCYFFEDIECWCATRDGDEIPDSRVVGLDNTTECDHEKFAKYYGK